MSIGSSIFMIVIGATLRYAVTWRMHGVNLSALGLILAVAGIVTLVLRLIWLFNPDLGEPRRQSAHGPGERQTWSVPSSEHAGHAGQPVGTAVATGPERRVPSNYSP